MSWRIWWRILSNWCGLECRRARGSVLFHGSISLHSVGLMDIFDVFSLFFVWVFLTSHRGNSCHPSVSRVGITWSECRRWVEKGRFECGEKWGVSPTTTKNKKESEKIKRDDETDKCHSTRAGHTATHTMYHHTHGPLSLLPELYDSSWKYQSRSRSDLPSTDWSYVSFVCCFFHEIFFVCRFRDDLQIFAQILQKANEIFLV